MNKYVERLYNGIIKENPTFVLMLGTRGEVSLVWLLHWLLHPVR